MINILICDDNKDFLSLLKNGINNIISSGKFADLEYRISCFNNSRTAFQFCSDCVPDITFLDIDMPEINGFNIAKEINEKNSNAMIIFVTNYENYVYTSLRYRPFRFIRKSHIDTELHEALQSALNELLCKNKYLELGSKYFNEKIFISKIIYFESKRNYAEIVCKDGNRYLYRSTLADLEKSLKCFDFLRVHAAYLVNMKFIDKLHKSTVELCNGELINISRRLYSQVHKSYSEYLRK